MKTPSGQELKLVRYPLRKKELLQAWDSADELILSHLHSEKYAGKKILVLNDSFGALSCGAEGEITTYTDSFLSFQGIRENSGGKIRALSRLSDIDGSFDLILLRIPKNLSFLEDMLAHATRHLKPGGKLICGYMVKHQAKSAFDLINRYIGTTTTSLAQRKARLIFASLEKAPVASPYPKDLKIEGFAQPFQNHSNLFSREKLDVGTRFLLENIPKGPFRTIVDLGCANGIIGIAAKRANPTARIIFTDESRMAIESARENYRRFFKDEAEFHWTNSFEEGAPESIDLVLCNPPFHQGTTIGDATALQMFQDAHRVLRVDGKIRVIGNSHLHYESALKKIFGKSEIVAKNAKFLVIDALKRG